MKAVTVAKWGNSLGIRLPDVFAKLLDISAGDEVTINIQNDSLLVKKAAKKATCVDYLEKFYGKTYEQLTTMNLTDEKELDWGAAVGEEFDL